MALQKNSSEKNALVSPHRLDERGDLWPREALHELMPRGRSACKGTLAHVALVVPNVVPVEGWVSWLSDYHHALPTPQAGKVNIFLAASTGAGGYELPVLLAFETVPFKKKSVGAELGLIFMCLCHMFRQPAALESLGVIHDVTFCDIWGA